MNNLNSLISNILINLDMVENQELIHRVINRVNNCISSEEGKARSKGESQKKSATMGHTKRDGASLCYSLRYSIQTTEKFETATLESPAMSLDATLNYIAQGQKKRLIANDYALTEDLLPNHVKVWLRGIVERVVKDMEIPTPEPIQA